AAGTVDEALQREHGLARARAAEEKAGAMARQPAAAHGVESLDAGGQLARILDWRLASRCGRSLSHDSPSSSVNKLTCEGCLSGGAPGAPARRPTSVC